MSDPQGFGPTTTENDTGSSGTAKPARSWLRPIMAIVAVAAIAAIAMVACAGAGGSWFLSGKNGGGEQIAEGTVPEATPPTATVEPVPTPATIAVADVDDPTWLRCAPPTDERPSPTYDGGKRRVFLSMRNTLSVNRQEHMEVRGLTGRPMCASGTSSDFELVEKAVLGTDGVCVQDVTDDGVDNPTPAPNLHVEWLCGDAKGKLVSTGALEKSLWTNFRPVAGLDGVAAKCCSDRGVDNACTFRPEPKTQGSVASNP
jgi:hypothetical protein